MALAATIYQFTIQLADIDRAVYESLDLRVARHPSETSEYMLTRVLAYCLEYQDGIALTEGISAEDEPAVVIRDLTGRITAWIEVGAPDAERLHRGSKLAGRAAVYTHRPPALVMDKLRDKKIHRIDAIPILAFESDFIDRAVKLIERRNALSLSITERQLYLEINGQTLTTAITEHRLT